MSQPTNEEELNALLNERKELNKQIQAICDAKPLGERARLLRRGSENSELYHTLVAKLGSITEKIEGIERKQKSKEKAVRFSNLRPERIPSPMPLGRTPPPTSTPFQTSVSSDIPGNSQTTEPISTAPIFTTTTTSADQNPRPTPHDTNTQGIFNTPRIFRLFPVFRILLSFHLIFVCGFGEFDIV